MIICRKRHFFYKWVLNKWLPIVENWIFNNMEDMMLWLRIPVFHKCFSMALLLVSVFFNSSHLLGWPDLLKIWLCMAEKKMFNSLILEFVWMTRWRNAQSNLSGAQAPTDPTFIGLTVNPNYLDCWPSQLLGSQASLYQPQHFTKDHAVYT